MEGKIWEGEKGIRQKREGEGRKRGMERGERGIGGKGK